MIGRSWPEYVFIRTAILGLRLVAPLSIVYLAASCRAGAFLWSSLLGAYTLVESAFFLFVYLPRSYRLQQDAKYPPRMSRAEREALFYKCANSMTSESISGWFIRSPGEHLCRDNVADWLLWALFSARRNDALPEWEEELDSYITVMGSYVGYPLEHGSNPEMQCLRLTMDPVPMVHRPFVWYMESLPLYTNTPSPLLNPPCSLWALLIPSLPFHSTPKVSHIIILAGGFKSFLHARFLHCSPAPPRTQRLMYPTGTDPTVRAQNFRSYSSTASVLACCPMSHSSANLLYRTRTSAFSPLTDVGILAIEILPICMYITEPPLAREVICDAITRILDAHGLRRIVLAGHSYGTAVSAYLLRRQWGTVDRSLVPVTTPTPHTHISSVNEDHVTYRDNVSDDDGDRGNLIAAVLLMDPIPFLLHHPSVAYNFVYRQPRRANERQLWYFSSRDPDTARALLRHFFWFECALFREDVLTASAQGDGRTPLPIAVSLSGRDQIVDGPAVRAYLTGGEQEDVDEEGSAGALSRWAQDELEVLYFPDLDHATVFDTRRDRSALLEVLHRFVRQEEAESEA
ncbi:hypothetical protein BC826DRAFT_1105012 [Russula brevipes]|nr:hypothetical protein BC826DRAFT_1105012 [Russula brevipes]